MQKTLKAKGIKLKVKKKKIIDLDEFAPKVKDLIAQISDKPINIKKITLIAADKEKLLDPTDNLAMDLEIYVVPGPKPHY